VTSHRTTGEPGTVALGRDLGRRLSAGDVVLIDGPLAAGKTAFVRGLAEGLGCDPDEVSSPTFTIVQEYRGTTRLQHADLYRLSPDEVDDLGLDDLGEESVLAVEWPDRWRIAPADAVRVRIATTGPTERRIVIDDPASTRRDSSALPS
jgi:tRNA threonylcarbamoyladenosine biosynthesis protein TsaE